jgi:hypothetical protein
MYLLIEFGIGVAGARREGLSKSSCWPPLSPDRDDGMTNTKLHQEFFRLEPAGYPAGIKQKIIAGSLDEPKRTGNRTRLLRFDPGAYTTAPFVHEYWEEVFLLSGDLIVGNDANGQGGERFEGYTYAVRPPGVYHGPFKSETGCLLLETHYFFAIGWVNGHVKARCP